MDKYLYLELPVPEIGFKYESPSPAPKSNTDNTVDFVINQIGVEDHE